MRVLTLAAFAAGFLTVVVSTVVVSTVVVSTVVVGTVVAAAQSTGRPPRHPPAAGTRHCAQDRAVPVPRAFARNDFWGRGAAGMCIDVNPRVPGFTVATSIRAAPGGVQAFPYIAYGCQWDACSAGTAFPRKLAAAGWPKVTWDTAGSPAGTYNRALDMWFDARPVTNGQATGGEVMVWQNSRGYRKSPIYRAPVVTIDGIRWHFDAWTTVHTVRRKAVRWRLIIFARVRGQDRMTRLSVRPFADYAITRHQMSRSVYWLSIDAGDEIQSLKTTARQHLRTTRFAVIGAK